MPNFGTERDLIFYPTAEFLESAADAGEGQHEIRTLSSAPEYVTGAEGVGVFLGSSADLSISSDAIAQIFFRNFSFSEPVGSMVHRVNKVEARRIEKAPALALTRTAGTVVEFLAISVGDAAGITADGLADVADRFFGVGSATDWFLGFASSPAVNFATGGDFAAVLDAGNCFGAALTGTGGDRVTGTCTAAEWLVVAEFGTNDTRTDLLMAGTDVVMKSDDPSLYLRFDFNFSAADLVDSEDSNPYDHLFIYRGEGTAVDFVCQLPEPDDARLNPGARVEAIFNVSAMGILEL